MNHFNNEQIIGGTNDIYVNQIRIHQYNAISRYHGNIKLGNNTLKLGIKKVNLKSIMINAIQREQKIKL